MRQCVIPLIVVTGLCFLPGCFPHSYIHVNMSLTWSDAQAYCRNNHSEMASIHNEDDMAQFESVIEEDGVWVGLRLDSQWEWSVTDPEYYGEGHWEFRQWRGNISDDTGKAEVCVTIGTDGLWDHRTCNESFHFFCLQLDPPDFVYVDQHMSWHEAQAFCRSTYTDLVSVRDPSENGFLKYLMVERAWIGLHRRNNWTWSDGGELSLTRWAPGAPTNVTGHNCIYWLGRAWENANCDSVRTFVCETNATGATWGYGSSAGSSTQPGPGTTANPRGHRHIIKMTLRKSDDAVQMEDLQQGILDKFNQRVKELGLEGVVKIRWVKQPDGRIFHKKEEEDNNPTCP